MQSREFVLPEYEPWAFNDTLLRPRLCYLRLGIAILDWFSQSWDLGGFFYDSRILPGLWLWSHKMCPLSCDEVVSSDYRSSYFAKFCGELMNWLLGKFLSYCIIWLMGILGQTIISCMSNISTCQWSWKNFWQLDIWIFNCCLNKFNLIYIWIID